jgi:hypothetical protein
MGGLRIASVVTGIIAVALWGVAVTGIWVHMEDVLLGDARVMAGALTVVSVLLLVAYMVRDRDKDALVRAMAEVTIRRGQAPTEPLHLRQVS